MTDYFAILDQPRQAWLDPLELKEKFHRLTAAHHPDTRAGSENTIDFSEVNAAYRTLSDPRNRLRHLIELQFPDALPHQTAVPAELAELFMELGALRREVDALLTRLAHATTPICRAALAADQYRMVGELGDRLAMLNSRYNGLIENLRTIGPRDQARLAEAYQQLSVLSKWIDQFNEALTRLTL